MLTQKKHYKSKLFKKYVIQIRTQKEGLQFKKRLIPDLNKCNFVVYVVKKNQIKFKVIRSNYFAKP